jgi:hypothetical protein
VSTQAAINLCAALLTPPPDVNVLNTVLLSD